MNLTDGYEKTKHPHAKRRAITDIPIIAMTANAFDEDRKTFFDAGMNGYASRPISTVKLSQVPAKVPSPPVIVTDVQHRKSIPKNIN